MSRPSFCSTDLKLASRTSDSTAPRPTQPGRGASLSDQAPVHAAYQRGSKPASGQPHEGAHRQQSTGITPGKAAGGRDMGHIFKLGVVMIALVTALSGCYPIAALLTRSPIATPDDTKCNGGQARLEGCKK
jgi:hypothetical protein